MLCLFVTGSDCTVIYRMILRIQVCCDVGCIEWHVTWYCNVTVVGHVKASSATISCTQITGHCCKIYILILWRSELRHMLQYAPTRLHGVIPRML